MRYRVKSYTISNNKIVLADPALSALTIEDVRLIVNETTTDENQQVLCSSAQKSSFVSGISTGATGATISFKSGVTIADTDKATIELDLGDSPSAANSAILTAVGDTKAAVVSAETEITSTVTSAETQVKNTVTSAETQIKTAISAMDTKVDGVSGKVIETKSAVLSAETGITTAITASKESILLVENIVREAVMGNIPEFDATQEYFINTVVKRTDTSVTPNVTKVYRANEAHNANVAWDSTKWAEVSVLSILNDFATGYNIIPNQDGEEEGIDTYTLVLDKSAQVNENELIIA